jgi:RNA polymerase sigma-70 factor (ECF subfamily)
VRRQSRRDHLRDRGDTPEQRVSPLVAAGRGDVDEFLDLVRAHDPQLRRLVGRMLTDRHRVDDVLQETYVRAYRAMDTFRRDAELGTWLHRIAYNCCIDELRAAQRRPRPVDSVPEPVAPGSGPGRRVAVQQAVRAALARLPEDQRAAVLLVDGNQLDFTAAAEVLGVPRGTVASRVSRGRAALRAQLAPDEEDLDDHRS